MKDPEEELLFLLKDPSKDFRSGVEEEEHVVVQWMLSVFLRMDLGVMENALQRWT